MLENSIRPEPDLGGLSSWLAGRPEPRNKLSTEERAAVLAASYEAFRQELISLYSRAFRLKPESQFAASRRWLEREL